MSAMETIRTLVDSDVIQSRMILEQHVRDNETHELLVGEVDDILSCMQGEEDEYHRLKKYFVAVQNGTVVGIMGYTVPDPDITAHFNLDTATSSEIVNVFVEQNHMGQGIGQQLLSVVSEELKEQGIKTIVVCSGPRYQKSWVFYDKTFDQSGGFIQNKFGPGRHAKTWIKHI